MKLEMKNHWLSTQLFKRNVLVTKLRSLGLTLKMYVNQQISRNQPRF